MTAPARRRCSPSIATAKQPNAGRRGRRRGDSRGPGPNPIRRRPFFNKIPSLSGGRRSSGITQKPGKALPLQCRGV